MKPPWQQQQQRRWQQQRREMGYAWEQQKKAKKKARAKKEQPVAIPPHVAGDRFSQVEAEVARLRQELAAGHLTEAQFRDRLEKLMVQDAQGNWWMIGVDTGQWYRYDGVDWVPGEPPRLAAPARLQPVAEAQAVSSSGVVYLYGHHFVAGSSRSAKWIEVPCRAVKVNARELAETAVAAAFIALAQGGHARLYIGNRRQTLGLTKHKSVFLEPLERGTIPTGLEGRIVACLRDRKVQNNTFNIVKRLVARSRQVPWSPIIGLIRAELVEQGHFVAGRGKIGELFLGKKHVPDCQRIATLQRQVEPVRNMIESFRQANPEIYGQLVKDIRLAMK
jgi:hypothetical protein